MSCTHQDLIETDPAGRSVCGVCGEVLRGAYQGVIPYGSGPDLMDRSQSEAVLHTPTTLAMVDSIIRQCEGSGGVQIPQHLRERVLAVLSAFKQATGMRPVYSYENLIRTALLVVIRSAGLPVPASKIIPRDDGRTSPAFALLTRFEHMLGLQIQPLDQSLLVRHCVEVILTNMRERGIYPCRILFLQPKSDIEDDVSYTVTRVLKLYCGLSNSRAAGKLHLILACSYLVVRFGCEQHPAFKSRNLSLSSCIRILDMNEFSQSVFKHYEAVRNLSFDLLTGIGIRRKDEREIFEHLADLEEHCDSRNIISKRMKLISETLDNSA